MQIHIAERKNQDGFIMCDSEIHKKITKEYPNIYILILNTWAFTDDERQYWIDNLSAMTPEHISTLLWILEEEKKKIEEINKNTEMLSKHLNEKHLIEWQELQK